MTRKPRGDIDGSRAELETYQHRSSSQKAAAEKPKPCLKCGKPATLILCQTCIDERYGGPLYQEHK